MDNLHECLTKSMQAMSKHQRSGINHISNSLTQLHSPSWFVLNLKHISSLLCLKTLQKASSHRYGWQWQPEPTSTLNIMLYPPQTIITLLLLYRHVITLQDVSVRVRNSLQQYDSESSLHDVQCPLAPLRAVKAGYPVLLCRTGKNRCIRLLRSA